MLADITRWLVANGPDGRVLSVHEHHYSVGDDFVLDLLHASFFENLEPAHEGVRAALEPRLAAALRKLEDGTLDDLEEPPA